MVIFVKAWCCIFATFLSRRTLCATYFPNLRRKLLSYFSERNLLKLLPKNFAGKLKTEPNFVDKLCTEIPFSGKSVVKWNLKLNVAWKNTLRDNPNFAEKLCVEFFKFRKYYAAHNSGLKIWLVSGIFEMAQLFNLKFWLYLWRLGVAFSPHF